MLYVITSAKLFFYTFKNAKEKNGLLLNQTNIPFILHLGDKRVITYKYVQNGSLVNQRGSKFEQAWLTIV